ncbi:hypothetical protein ABZY34_04775 [Streptomyces virginiae]|uniref:hypothetical protein n=1 Tax=Streptomyces virginiae TaxID=1961 RepID=UPI0033ABD228
MAELSYTTEAHLTYAKGVIPLASALASLLAAVILGRRSRHYHRLAQPQKNDQPEAPAWTRD